MIKAELRGWSERREYKVDKAGMGMAGQRENPGNSLKSQKHEKEEHGGSSLGRS